MRPRERLRRKVTPYDQLGLDDAKWTDDQLIDLMLQNPILINRPVRTRGQAFSPVRDGARNLPNLHKKPFVK